jgi:hypothetical protein
MTRRILLRGLVAATLFTAMLATSAPAGTASESAGRSIPRPACR